MIGLTITGNPITSCSASSSDQRNIHHQLKRMMMLVVVVNTALATAKDPGNDVTDVSGTAVDNNTPTTTH
jgi:hypothetical protein